METLLTPEQERRVAVFQRYEKIAAPVRELRNGKIAEFEKGWSDRMMNFIIESDQNRYDRMKALQDRGISETAARARVALEIAVEFESLTAEKDAAARKLDESLEKPMRWRDFVKQELDETPGDPVLMSLLEEADKVDHDLAVDGFLKSPPPERVLSDLTAIEEEKGVAFKRGMQTVFRDAGPRLDVFKLDDRDIESALKVAAQKFDPEKGLLLTGDTAFKTRAAEIAGKLGLKLRNTEPEVLMAWARGAEKNPQLSKSVAPSVARGIEGDERQPEINRYRGEQLLRIAPETALAWGDDIEKHGLTFEALGARDGFVAVKMPADRMEKAFENWRSLDKAVMDELQKADLSKPDGGLKLSDNARRVLVEREMISEDGTLKPAGVDVVLLRDDHVLRSREDAKLKQIFAPGADLKTSHEFVREAAGELRGGRKRAPVQERAEAQEQIEKAEEKSAQQQDEKQQEVKSEELTVDAPKPRAKKKEVDLGIGM